MIKAPRLQSDVTILKLISKAKIEEDNRTEKMLREFRDEEKLECPDCLFELRNGIFIETGDYIIIRNGTFFYGSANGSHTEVDSEFIYEFCRGCAKVNSN